MRINVRTVVAEGVTMVDLPTYTMVGPIDPNTGRVDVEVPGDYFTDGQLDVTKIRHMYRGQPRIDRPDLGDRLRDTGHPVRAEERS